MKRQLMLGGLLLLATTGIAACTPAQTPQQNVEAPGIESEAGDTDAMITTRPGIYRLPGDDRARVVGMLELDEAREEMAIRLARPIDSYLGDLVVITNPQDLTWLPDGVTYVAVIGRISDEGEYAASIEAEDIEGIDWAADMPASAQP